MFLGLGYVAKAMIRTLPRGDKIYGTSRNPDRWNKALKSRVTGIEFKGDISDELRFALAKADYIICSIPPNAQGDVFLSSLTEGLASLQIKAKWFAYLSATSVYGDRQGRWAFEDELLRPVNARGRYRIEAELDWLEQGAELGLPVHVFRLAGIYGGEYFGQSRNPFGRIRSGKARAIIKEGHIVNRIHADDIVSVLHASIERPNAGQVYNIADGNPAPPQDVLDFAADLIGQPPPKRVALDDPSLSDMARSFYNETKRIDITRAKKTLNWQPMYKNYQSGLLGIYKSESQ